MPDQKDYYKMQFISSIEYHESEGDCITRNAFYTNDIGKAIKFIHTQISFIQVLRFDNPVQILEITLHNRETQHTKQFTEKQILNT